MTNNTINQKSFTLILNNTKTFILKIVNFAVSTSLFILLRISSIHFTTIVKQRIRNTLSLFIPKIVLTTIYKIRTRMILTLSARTIKILTIVKARNREISNILIRVRFTTITKRLLRTLTSMKSGFIHFVLTPIVAVLIKLSTLDPQLLSSLDSSTLAQMDHS